MTPIGPRHERPTIGLVLGAGGIRGCAHAGVITVLREAGIPIDVVVGASIGAVFGLALAADVPTARIAQAGHDDCTPANILRFYLGRLRCDRSNPISRLIADAAQDRDLSQLSTRFAVLVIDMHTGMPEVISRGPVLPAIQASIAVPFFARPVQWGDRVYVDGGILDTAPVYVAREMGADRVITVCLGHNYAAPAFLRRRPWTRGVLQRLGKQNTPATRRLRDQIRFGLRFYASIYDPPAPAEDSDVTIWPDMGSVGPNSPVGGRFCFEQGVRAAREALPAIERLLHSPPPLEKTS